MSDLRERFLQYLLAKELDGNLRNVERMIGLSNGALDKIGDGTRKQTIDKISIRFPDLNITWLKTGEGSMIKTAPLIALNNAIEDHIIKYYDVEATAGNVEVFDDAKATYKNIVIPGFDDCDFALNVLGDSMYPELKSGQIAILKEWKEPYIEFGHTYMVVTKTGHRMIKRLRSSKQKDEVICESANEIYDSFELKKDDINKLFLVKGHVERSAI